MSHDEKAGGMARRVVAILGTRQIYEKASVALRGDSRAHLGRDRILRDGGVRLDPVGTSVTRPAAEARRVRMDGHRPTTLSGKLGSRQIGLRPRRPRKGTREYRRPVARAHEAVYGTEGLGGESDRLGDILFTPLSTGGNGQA